MMVVAGLLRTPPGRRARFRLSTPEGRGNSMGRLSAACAAIVAMFVFTAAASAIVYGEPDGGGHPNVGALLAPQAYSDGTWAGCTGTLISPTVFLTAEHCDFGVDRIAVTFASTYVPGKSKVYWGTWHGDPLYSNAQGDPHDVAVVVLDKAVTGITPARLPAAGSLSNLPSNQGFTSVGYGAQSVTIDHGPTFHYADIRLRRDERHAARGHTSPGCASR